MLSFVLSKRRGGGVMTFELNSFQKAIALHHDAYTSASRSRCPAPLWHALLLWRRCKSFAIADNIFAETHQVRPSISTFFLAHSPLGSLFLRDPRKKPLFIRPATPIERDVQSRLKYPPVPERREGEVANGIVGTLVRLLDELNSRETEASPLPLKHLLSSPPLLLLALRNLENQRRRHPIRQTDVVQEACLIVSSFLEFAAKRQYTETTIPPDAELTRCFLRPSHVSPRTFVDYLRRHALADEDDLRFIVRAIQELRWKTAKGRSRRYDPSWRWTPKRQNAKKTTWIFRLSNAQPNIEYSLDEDSHFALGSVHRPQWRVLPVQSYTSVHATWILSIKERARGDERNRHGVPSKAKTYACMDGVAGPNGHFADDVEDERRRSILLQQLYTLHFSRIVRRIQRRYNQKVVKIKSPDTIPIVNKPSPTLIRPERRVSFEMRRMVPTIHMQRYRGMQFRDHDAQTKGFALYWYDSRYADILASLAEIECRLAKLGISLFASELGKPDAQELLNPKNEKL